MLMYSILADLGTHNYFRVTMSHQERVVVGNNYLPFESLTLQNWVGDRNAGLTYCNRSPFDAVTWKNLHMPIAQLGRWLKLQTNLCCTVVHFQAFTPVEVSIGYIHEFECSSFLHLPFTTTRIFLLYTHTVQYIHFVRT